MKLTKLLLAFSLLSGIIFSCQKELEFDPNGPSQGTLKKDNSSNCLPSVVNGVYAKDTVLNTTHYIDVQVDVKVIGTYTIQTDSLNGYSFKTTGKFTNKGLQTVRLMGTGKPLAAGLNIFTVTYNSSQCTIAITVTGPGTGIAVFSLENLLGICSGAIVNGTYTAGTPLTPANTVELKVNVGTIGTYAIAAAGVNGMVFSATGTFTTTGVQPVVLTGTGTPVTSGISTLTATNLSSSCTFVITVLPGGGGGAAAFTFGGAPTGCTPPNIGGIYTAGTTLTAANTVTIDINVTTLGTYTINAVSAPGNNYSFSKTGTFTNLGSQQITLNNNSGTPTNAGTDNFIVTATGILSTCTFPVTVNPAGTGAAAFTFGGAGGACTPATVNGTYTAGTALTAANTVTIQVNVTTAGTYTINATSSPSNNYSFTKSGTFAVGNNQNVTLNGSGTPTSAGTNTFTVTSAQAPSNCTFNVTVNPAANNDLFPLTANSWWSYDSDKYAAPDTLLKKATILRTLAGNSYREVEASQNTQPYFDTVHYRKSGNDYFEYVTVDSFFSNYFFTDYQFHELNFLKENATAGTTWSSAEFSGIELGSSPPTPLKLKYSYTVASTTGTLVVNGITYTNVTKIDVKAQANPNNTGYVDDAIMEFYYSKGVGLIRFNFKDAASPGWDYNDDIRNYQVF